jgi:hypothetical protein
VVNSPGLIDSGYRGEIQVVLLNTDREETFVAGVGDRIAQLVILPAPEISLREVEELPESARGVRGFGSGGGQTSACVDKARSSFSIIQVPAGWNFVSNSLPGQMIPPFERLAISAALNPSQS